MKILIITIMLAGFFPTIAAAQSIDTSTCGQAITLAMEWNSDATEPDLAYDTMHFYILHCYQIANASETFGALGGCWGSQLNTLQGRLDERSFLIDALKLRNDNEWFCDDVEMIGGTFDDNNKTENYPDILTILKYLIDNPRCVADTAGLKYEYDVTRAGQKQLWNDTANVYYKNEVFDSTLPTMQDLGLDSVLMFGAQAGVQYEAIGPQIIGNAQLSPNPTTNGATVTLEIEREAYVHIELFDLLGNKIGQTGFEGVFEPGTSATSLNLEGLHSGSYFVRITTANNEVRTLKLEKE
jgi:hypothetical protein